LRQGTALQGDWAAGDIAGNMYHHRKDIFSGKPVAGGIAHERNDPDVIDSVTLVPELSDRDAAPPGPHIEIVYPKDTRRQADYASTISHARSQIRDWDAIECNHQAG